MYIMCLPTYVYILCLFIQIFCIFHQKMIATNSAVAYTNYVHKGINIVRKHKFGFKEQRRNLWKTTSQEGFVFLCSGTANGRVTSIQQKSMVVKDVQICIRSLDWWALQVAVQAAVFVFDISLQEFTGGSESKSSELSLVAARV